jgi:hypothetical protein
MMSIAIDLVSYICIVYEGDSDIVTQEATVYAKSRGDAIVGFYQSTERLGDVLLSPIGEKVVSNIKQSFPNAVALVVCFMSNS